MTPLAEILTARIHATGPISVAEFMDTCLLHPDHGYYSTRDPLGRAGDFTTAPEIHQLFGELCGLALAQAWMDQGRPNCFSLAEPGPGRGTLMADIQRATRNVPGFSAAADTVLIEASAHLRRIQQKRLGDVRHLDRLLDLPEQPLYLIANEFLDALPIRQFQRVPQGWAERMIGLHDNKLSFGLGPPVDLPREGEIDQVVEICPAAIAAVDQIATRIAAHGGAAILFDYGGWNGTGDTFQALRGHAPDHPLASPGEADLTAHVDFAPLAVAVQQAGAIASKPVTQGNWLLSLGAAERAERLQAAGDAGAMAALHRLTHASEMGQLFKVLAIWPQGAPPVPGFEALEADADDA